jgi:predicted GNAT family acetyltransferase
MSHPLDKPIWAALTSRQSEFALGSPPALRFRPQVEPFIATIDSGEESVAAMRPLMVSGEEVILLQSEPTPVPSGVRQLALRSGVQMIAETAEPMTIPDNVERLGPADAPEMQALAELTKPGPFRSETHRLGTFWGIRENGRLLAMAGERLKFDGWTEVSAVCCHPDARGRGYARLLSRLVMARIVAAGEQPFLHAYADNYAAIGLYESLGFRLRSEVYMQVLALD